MTVETFFEKFEVFADTPNAVEKMRELVLSLAVSGALVSQDRSDEPASSQLKSAADRLPPEKRRRGPSPLPPVEDRPGDTPAGWCWARFQDVAFIASNLVQPASYLDAKHLAPDNIEKGNGVLLPCRTIREDKVKSAKHRFYSGQLVYSKIRPNLSKVAVVDFDGLCSADMYPIDALIEPRYLLFYMLSRTFLRQAVKADTRVAMPKINQDELNAIAVPVPPLAEQKRIVAKVDELMGLCDRLKAEQAEREAKHAHLARAALARFAEAPTPANLTFLFHDAYTIEPADLRKAILTLAVQGKIVPQDDTEGDADKVLMEVAREHRERGLRTPKVSAESYDDPFVIPSRWKWIQLGRLALQIQYGYTASANPAITDIRMLRITDIQNNRVDWPSVPGCAIEDSEAKKYLLEPNDILIARTGGTIGKSFIVPDAPVKSVFASYLIRVTPPQSIFARYLKLVLESPLYWDQLRGMAAGTGQPNVNGQALGRLSVPLPPLPEQRRIVAKVDQLMALVDQLEAQLAESRATGDRLMEAVVAELTATTHPLEGSD